MKSYDFKFTDFALSEKGIHLLRNRYNHKTIPFNEVDKAIIRKDVETKNVLLTLIFGILLLSFAILQIISVINNFNDPEIHIIHAETIILPLLPAIAGAFCIYISTKKIPILRIESGNQKHKLSLKDAVKMNKEDELRIYLEEKLHHSFIYNL